MAEQWISARDTLALVTQLKNGEESAARVSLLTLLMNGTLESVASKYECNDEMAFSLNSMTDVVLSNNFWGLVHWKGPGATVDWDFGIFGYSYSPRGADHRQFENATGVKFNGQNLRTLVGERAWREFETQVAQPVAPPVSLPVKSGGRPPAAFADNLMCAIWASIYRGDLKPRRQADVEAAIKDWVVEAGHELGDTVTREKARKIWAAMTDEVGNSGT